MVLREGVQTARQVGLVIAWQAVSCLLTSINPSQKHYLLCFNDNILFPHTHSASVTNCKCRVHALVPVWRALRSPQGSLADPQPYLSSITSPSDPRPSYPSDMPRTAPKDERMVPRTVLASGWARRRQVVRSLPPHSSLYGNPPAKDPAINLLQS